MIYDKRKKSYLFCSLVFAIAPISYFISYGLALLTHMDAFSQFVTYFISIAILNKLSTKFILPIVSIGEEKYLNSMENVSLFYIDKEKSKEFIRVLKNSVYIGDITTFIPTGPNTKLAVENDLFVTENNEVLVFVPDTKKGPKILELDEKIELYEEHIARFNAIASQNDGYIYQKREYDENGKLEEFKLIFKSHDE